MMFSWLLKREEKRDEVWCRWYYATPEQREQMEDALIRKLERDADWWAGFFSGATVIGFFCGVVFFLEFIL